MCFPKECLICCGDTEDNWSDIVTNQVTAYFIVSKLFEISDSTYTDWLSNGKSPADWISFCKSCLNSVKEAQTIFTQFVELEAKWKRAKRDVESDLCQNYKQSKHGANYFIPQFIRQQTLARLECGPETLVIKRETQCEIQYSDEVKHENNEEWPPHMFLDKEDSSRKANTISRRKMTSKLAKRLRKLKKKVNRKALLKNDCLQEEGVDSDFAKGRSGRNIKRVQYTEALEEEDYEEDDTIQPKSDETDGESDYNPEPDVIDNYAKDVDDTKISMKHDELCCRFCSKTFKTLNMTKLHERRTHSKRHKCKNCDKEYSSYVNLRDHMDLHHPSSEDKAILKPHECSQCGMFFKTETSLECHVKKVHQGVDKAYICKCGKAFAIESNLRRHELSIHNENMPFHCKKCKFGTSTESNLKRHELQVHDSKPTVNCPKCSKEFKTEYYVKKHIESVHDKQRNFVCEHCSASFQQMSLLRYHQMGQHKVVFEGTGYSVTCEHCGKVLSNPSGLRKHILSVHEKKYLFHCPICKAGRNSKDQVDRHIIVAHTDKRPFVCSLCQKSYITKTKLADHVRTHTGEKPFSCSVCLKAFSCKKYLEAHEKIHVTERTYQCDLCPKSFPNNQYLGHHKWYVHQRQQSKMPPKQLVDKAVLEALADSGGYKKTRTLLSDDPHT